MSKHWMVVTVDEDDGYTVDFECEEPGDACIPWVECRKEHEFTEEEEDDGEGFSHGEFHQRWYFGWATRASACALVQCYEAAVDSGYDLSRSLGPGRHEVWFEWDDEYTILVGVVA